MTGIADLCRQNLMIWSLLKASVYCALCLTDDCNIIWINLTCPLLSSSVLTPMYKQGAGLLVKTHHGVLKTTGQGRSRDLASWRMAHIRRFKGRGMLLLRNPYTTVISHWNHRLVYWKGFVGSVDQMLTGKHKRYGFKSPTWPFFVFSIHISIVTDKQQNN